MKKTILSFFASLLVVATYAQSETHVDGYYRSNGTYVEPHYRTMPNNTTSDNWSTVGNQNPHTSEWGTHYPTHEYNNSYTPAPTSSYNTPTYSTPVYQTSQSPYTPTTQYRTTSYYDIYRSK